MCKNVLPLLLDSQMLLCVSLTQFMIGWPHVHFAISLVFSVCVFFNCMIFHSAFTFRNTYVIAEIAVILTALKSILNAITADAIVLSFIMWMFFFFFGLLSNFGYVCLNVSLVNSTKVEIFLSSLRIFVI